MMLFQKKWIIHFLTAMSEFVHHAISRKEVGKTSDRSILVHCICTAISTGKNAHVRPGMRGGPEKFVLDDKIMNQTLKLVLKALKP